MTKYYRYIGDDKYDFTANKIYECKNPDNLEAPFNFIDDSKHSSGWSGSNYIHFTPATLEEWVQQNSLKSDYSYLIKFFKKHNIK